MSSASQDPRRAVVARRVGSISAVMAAAVGILVTFPVLVVVLAAVDLVRLRPRLPLVRLTSFALCWAWLETVGVAAAGLLWFAGRRRDTEAHYRLQRWWANQLMRSLRATCGFTVDIGGSDELLPTPSVVLVRHASLADSLLTAWVITAGAGLRPRFVLKKELLADPCLDIVGNRLPNCFLDRQAEDSAPGLEEIAALGADMTDGDVAIIFPEGTRANDAKRRRALERIGERDPERAARLAGLTNVLPPRPSGTAALLSTAPSEQVVAGWHVGFDGLDTFRGIIAALGRPRTTIRIRFERVDGPPTDPDRFERWLDDLWLRTDQAVGELNAIT